MRNLVLSVLLASTSLAACATTATTRSGAHPVNVAAVRTDIKVAISSAPGQAGPRNIVSMGEVTATHAQIWTDATDGRREESWVRGPQGWALADAKVVAKR